MAKLQDLFFNRVIEGKFIGQEGDEFPSQLPAPAGQGGKVLAVKSDGSGYELKPIEGVSNLYWHGIEVNEVVDNSIKLSLNIVIINNSSTHIENVNDLVDTLMSFGENAYVNADGFINKNDDGLFALGFYITPSTSQLWFCGHTGSFVYANIVKLDSEWKTYLTNAVITDRVNQLL